MNKPLIIGPHLIAALLLISPTVTAENSGAADQFSVVTAIQTLVMERDFGNDARGSSAAVSVSLEFDGQLHERVGLEAQLVQANRLYQEGRPDAAYWLSNDNATTLNALSLTVDLDADANDSSRLKIGRLRDDYDFFPTYRNARHKVQAWEGVVWQTKPFEGVSLDLGHLERYSSWSSREGGPSVVNGDFISLSERLGMGSSDSGVQFFSGTAERGGYTVTAYNYFARDLYNNFGIKVSRPLSWNEPTSPWGIHFRYDRQDGVSGGMMPVHDAEAIEVRLSHSRGAFSWHTGWTHIGAGNSYLAPFRTSHEIDMSFLWFTNQYEAGTDSLHWKGVWKKGGWVLYGLLVGADHRDCAENEINVAVRHTFANGMWVALFGGYGHRDFDDPARRSQWARDLRSYWGYSF